MKKHFFIILLLMMEIHTLHAQCSWASSSINSYNHQITNFGTSVPTDTLIICSGGSINLNIDQPSLSTIIDWKINGIEQGKNTSIDSTFINESSTPIYTEYIALFEFNLDCWADTLIVKVHPKPTITLTAKNLSCYNISLSTGDGAIYVESNHPIQSTSYIGGWNTSYYPISNNSSNHDTIQSLTADDYHVFITDTNNCNSDTISVTITQPEELIINSTDTINDNCGQGTGSVIFHTTGGTTPYTYTLTDANNTTVATSQDSIINGLEGEDPSGITYYYSLTDANGCQIPTSTTNLFTILERDEDAPNPPDYGLSSPQYCPNEPLVIMDKNSTTANLPHQYYIESNLQDIYYTNTGTLTIPTETLNGSEVLHITAIGEAGADNEGCLSDTILVGLEQKNCEDTVITTNSFSPNGNLYENTTFKIDLSYIEDEGFKGVKVTIFNRWGDIVYKTNNYDNKENAWDGKNLNGEFLAEGTYFYIIEIPNVPSISNWVYLDLK